MLTVPSRKKFVTSSYFLEYHHLPCNEFLMYVSVHDEIKVALSKPRLLVLQSEVKMRQHMQAGSQQGHCLWNHTQLSLLCLSCEKEKKSSNSENYSNYTQYIFGGGGGGTTGMALEDSTRLLHGYNKTPIMVTAVYLGSQ